MNFFHRRLPSYFLHFCLIILAVTQLPATAFCQSTGIIAFGDSLTEGCDVHIQGNSICGWLGGYGYENNLRVLLAKNGYDDFALYNYGRGGEVTADGVNRLDSVLNNSCTQDTGYILLMEGTNDLFHHKTWGDVLFNLDIMVEKSRAKGIVPLLATLTPDPEHEFKDIPLMNQKIREYAASKVPPVILVEQYDAVAPYWNSYTNPLGCYGDLLHPNPAGFDAIGATWYKSLSQLLPRNTVPLPWLMLLLGKP